MKPTTVGGVADEIVRTVQEAERRLKADSAEARARKEQSEARQREWERWHDAIRTALGFGLLGAFCIGFIALLIYNISLCPIRADSARRECMHDADDAQRIDACTRQFETIMTHCEGDEP